MIILQCSYQWTVHFSVGAYRNFCDGSPGSSCEPEQSESNFGEQCSGSRHKSRHT